MRKEPAAQDNYKFDRTDVIVMRVCALAAALVAAMMASGWIN